VSLFRRRADQSPSSGRHRIRHRPGPGGTGSAPGLPTNGGDAQEQFIIDALNDLRDMAVREVMTPRVDVVALPLPLTVDAVSRAVRESGHSRFPVYLDDLDHLVGVLFVTDLFRAGWMVGRGEAGTGGGKVLGASASVPSLAAEGGKGPEGQGPGPLDLSRRVRQPFLVPESRLVLDALAEMRRQRRAFAVVVDEHGGVEGVLTVKDLLGALVGDLADEFDSDDEPEVVRVDGNRWLVDGRTSVDDLQDALDISLPEGEYVTLGGYLFDAFGHIPTEGERTTVGDWELRVAEMDKRRIAKVVAKRLHPISTEGENAEAGPGSASSIVG
jgi:CBS domain containing-hemolysin-like protein